MKIYQAKVAVVMESRTAATARAASANLRFSCLEEFNAPLLSVDIISLTFLKKGNTKLPPMSHHHCTT